MYAESFGVAFVVAVAATLLVRTVARRYGWVAAPRPDRWHRRPTALYGGIGIFVGFIAAYLWSRPDSVSGDALLVACSAGLFAVGLFDDRFQLKPYIKLIAQITFATLFTVFGLRLNWIPNPILDQGLTIFWLVGITNALNLLDNIDGAAAGIAAIASGYLVYFSHAQGAVDSAQLAAAFTGAVTGFLVFNFNPASIFMGDCGALFLGFFLGGLTLVNSSVTGARRNTFAIVTLPVLLMLMPIIDTTLVTISRRYYGRKVSVGGRDHTSHRLVALGMSERRATLMLWTLAAASGGVAVMVEHASTMVAVLLVAMFAMATLFLMVFLGRVKVYEGIENESEGRGRALLPTLADFSHKRRMFEILNDLVLILLAYYGAFLLRFEPVGVQARFLPQFIRSVPLVIITQLLVFLAAGMYRGVWRYTGLEDLSRIVRAVGGAVILGTVVILFVFRFEGFSRTVMIIDGALLLLGVAGSRVSFRLLRNWLVRRRPVEGRRVLIYGAGDGGELLLREIQNNAALNMVPVGFVDDDPQKTGRMIHGVRVIGTIEQLRSIIDTTNVEEVVASTVKIDPTLWRQVNDLCQASGLPCRRMRIAIE